MLQAAVWRDALAAYAEIKASGASLGCVLSPGGEGLHLSIYLYIYIRICVCIYLSIYIGVYLGEQILALTLLHIHTLPGGPLPLLCSRAHAGVVLPPPSHTPTKKKTQETVCGSLGAFSL